MADQTPPTVEPLSVRAGDTWRWTRFFAGYPAPDWSLAYTLYGPAGSHTLLAEAAGAAHRIAVAPSVTAAIQAGRWEWVAYVWNAADRYTVARGVIEVLPDLAALSGVDGRSHARRVLEAIESAIAARATDGDLALLSSTFGSEHSQHGAAWSSEELRAWRSYYAQLVAQEDQAAAAARGESPGLIRPRWRA